MHRYSLLFLISFLSCQQQRKPDEIKNVSTVLVTSKKNDDHTFDTHTVSLLDDNIRSIYQDMRGNYWFGTNAAGVYRFDPSVQARINGNKFYHYTEKDGLTNNQILQIQEDDNGNIWFGTGLFGVSRFETAESNKSDKLISSITIREISSLESSANVSWKKEAGDLWFYAGGGVLRYSHNSLSYLPLAETMEEVMHADNAPQNLSRYAVYAMLKDKNGNLWFGTQAQGVCRYDGASFTWFTDKGLLGPAVLGLFEDSKGNIWMGNNGAGLFRYDGKSLINFTEEKGLGNPAFRSSGKSGPGTLARVYAINEDQNGNLWIGTVDAGTWQYDGIKLKNYTTKDGLGSDAVNTIYKDKGGELWFGTDDAGVYRFNGVRFVKFGVE